MHRISVGRRVLVLRLSIFLIVLSGCVEMDATVEEDRTKVDGPTTPSFTNRIDPTALAVGDTVLGLRIVSMDVHPSLVDTTGWTGVVQFDGRITVSGSYRPHPEYPEPGELCFFPDDDSADRLPVFPNDRRYAWFCFTNQERAWEELEAPPAEGRATITVDAYRYHYTHSDVYNTAALVGVGAPIDSLAGVEWVLTDLQDQAVLEDSRITLTVTGDAAHGYGGCNWYGGRLSESGDSLQIEEVAQTARLCFEPPGVVEQEERFMRLLAAVRSYRASGDSLQLRDSAGERVLTFRSRTARAMNPDDLIGSQWKLEMLTGRTLGAGERITLAFEEDRALGFAGCRNYTGTYSADGDAIRFPSLTMTEMECADEEMIEMEGRYTTALSETAHYWLRGDRLDLFTVGGDTLAFVEASDE